MPTLTPEEFPEWMRRDMERLQRTLKTLYKSLAIKLRGAIQRQFNDGQGADNQAWRPLAYTRPRGGNKPLLDTGRLRASIVSEATADGATAGSNAPQAALMDRGGTVTPKKGKFLAIPLTRQAQLAGSPRRFPKELHVKFGRKGGLMFEVRGKGKKAKEVPQYALTRQVTIPARPFLGWADTTILECERLVADYLQRKFGG